MDGRVEELAERIKEKNPGQDSREHLEFGVVVFQVHEFVCHHGFEFILLEELEGTSRNQDVAGPSTHRQGDRIIRLDDTQAHVGHSLELSKQVQILLHPSLALVRIPRRKLPDHGCVPVTPCQDGDEDGYRKTTDDRPEHSQRHAVPRVRDHPGLRHAQDEARRDERPEEQRERVQPCEEAHAELRIPAVRDEYVEQGSHRGTADREYGQGKGREPVVLEGLPDYLNETRHPASPSISSCPPELSALQAARLAAMPGFPKGTRRRRRRTCRPLGRPSWPWPSDRRGLP